jgi:hypothetical protein
MMSGDEMKYLYHLKIFYGLIDIIRTWFLFLPIDLKGISSNRFQEQFIQAIPYLSTISLSEKLRYVFASEDKTIP